MYRISSQMTNSDTQYNLRLQEMRQNKVDKQVASQQRIQELRDDPLAAGHLVRYQSYKGRIDRFEKNALTMSDQLSVREGYMKQNLDVLQRVRELAVQGSNGIYSKEDLHNMAVEVDELLGEMIQNANAVGPDGKSLFSGTRTNGTAFEVDMGNVPGSGSPLITNVRYSGDMGNMQVEVDENAYITLNNSGNRTFWAEPQQLFAERDATGWQAAEDSVISVDGQQIKVSAGDNVYSLVSKINDSGTAVKASIDPITHGLNLTTTDSRQLWLQDVSGNTLNQLGLIKDSSQQPPYNLAASAKVVGGSLFDSVIALRDALLSGDTEQVGTRVLASLDSGLDNLVTHIAKSGSEYERLQSEATRNSATSLNTAQMISAEGDLDFTKAVTDMKMLDYVQQATLSRAGKMYSSTLLNYMR
ncbi:MAG: flagellar hook-associated protein 3 [Spirochaetaceae bacterium]|nr:flagellar hook-associated protein 3 [Spirochaetaceae bacterium]